MNGHNDGNNKRLTAEEERESLLNKRIKTSPSPRTKPPSLHSQLLLMQKIKAKYPSSSSIDIKVDKEWYQQWEAYCLRLNSFHPPPIHLAHDDDPDKYVLLHPRAVHILQTW